MRSSLQEIKARALNFFHENRRFLVTFAVFFSVILGVSYLMPTLAPIRFLVWSGIVICLLLVSVAILAGVDNTTKGNDKT